MKQRTVLRLTLLAITLLIAGCTEPPAGQGLDDSNEPESADPVSEEPGPAAEFDFSHHPDAVPDESLKEHTSEPLLLPDGYAFVAHHIAGVSYEELIQWYGEKHDGWTLNWSRSERWEDGGTDYRVYRKNDDAAVLIFEDYGDDGIPVFTAILPWNVLFNTSAVNLQNLGVEIAPYDPETGRAGALDYRPAAEREHGIDPSQDRPFVEFGGVTETPYGEERLPHFTYLTHTDDAAVIAPIDGVVTRTSFQPNNDDYAIFLKPETAPQWTVELDHVTDLTVVEGDTVTAGDTLGTTSAWHGQQGWVELLPRHEYTGFYCPLVFMDDETREEYEPLITELMNDWEAFTDADVYDQESHWAPGCTDRTLTGEDTS